MIREAVTVSVIDIPYAFKRQLIDCKPGTPYFKQYANVNADTLPGYLTALAIILLGIILLGNILTKLLPRSP